VAHEGRNPARRNFDVEVRLRSNAADRGAEAEQALDQLEKGRALSRDVLEIVLVEEKDGVRVGGLRLFEGADHVAFLPQGPAPVTLAQAVAVLGDRFVDDVPAHDAAPVAAHQRLDVAVVLGGEAGAGQIVGEDLAALRVPDDRMAVGAQAMRQSELDHPVGGGKVVDEARTEGALHFLLPLRRELGAVAQDGVDPDGVVQLAGYAGGAERRGNDVLERRSGGGRGLGGWTAAGGEREAGAEDQATGRTGPRPHGDGGRVRRRRRFRAGRRRQAGSTGWFPPRARTS